MFTRWFCLVAATLLALGTSSLAHGASKPNVIVILADDLGYGDVQCYGGKIPTPHIDRLAAAGMRFTDAHSSSSVCSPTRYGLLTGRYNWRSKLNRGVLGGLSPRLIEPGRMTVASLLKEQGYHTGCFGKWHLGMDWAIKPGTEVSELNIEPREQVFNVDYARPIANGPNSVGFDYYYGIAASLDMVPYTFIENDRVTVAADGGPGFPDDARTRAGRQDPPRADNARFRRRGRAACAARKSCEFIDRWAADARADKPFFLYLPLASPHTPILPTSDWQDKSGINPYADFVMQTDAAVGEILAALDRQQLTANTLVILTSDNGCSPQAKFEELAAHGHHPSGPLRGHKADIFEGGHRVPFVVRWPGQVAARTESRQLVCLIDILATVAEILDCPLPDDAGEDSISFLPAAAGSRGDADHLVSHSINGTFAIRRGAWKLALGPDSGGWTHRGRAASKLPIYRACSCTTWPMTWVNNTICRTASRSGCGS